MCLRFLQSAMVGVLFFACTPKQQTYRVEGHINGLTSSLIYAVTTSELTAKMDTIIAKNGEFSYESSSDSLTSIVFQTKTEGFSAWFTVWVQNGDTISLSGNANHPELIEIHGNEINELLTQFRQNHKTFFLSRDELGSDKKDELYQNLYENICAFVEEHPQSIASLVLIQDYLMESENYDRITEALNRIEAPAKNSLLYESLNEIYRNMPEE